MNFKFLNLKNDANLHLNKNLLHTKKKVNNEKYFSFEYNSRINFRRKIEILHFQNWQKTCEFNNEHLGSGLKVINEANDKLLLVSEYLNEENEVLCSDQLILSRNQVLDIQYPKLKETNKKITFRILIQPKLLSRLKFSLLNYRCLNKKKYIQSLKGTGIEIGPGHNPQVKEPGVKYLEKYPLDQWKEANKINDVSNLNFKQYIIGPANDIPVEAESLDFIFSSHVFEHLYNPIGHLAHWCSKLKLGGKVACVVPSIYGAKDYYAEPSKIKDMIDEEQENSFDIPLRCYEHYNDIRGWKLGGQQLKNEDRSIHVHFYEEKNIKELLSYAIKNLGYTSMYLDYDRNHKDFYFELIK